MTDATLFIREFVRTRRDTGAIAPSSSRLARALARHVAPGAGHPRAVLEVGPGTGAVTRHIKDRLGPQDTLDLAEANPRFAELLQRAYGDDPRLRLLTGPVQEHELDSYDTIVCGLPFANFDAATTEEILGGLLSALRPGGTLSFFAYAGIPPLRRVLTVGTARERTLAVQAVLGRTLRRHAFRTETVLGNLPPARVHHLAPAGEPALRAG
ncbi:class I SAM-dependent methyltransferase [Streptomyces chitinivorans]|uniref:Class I SAM-dependent methyltransferase n=1 Tax=Streptomyces chitinivorans TaxID=1257027 RepID=A0ABW7HYT2_9ACTN|nr:methyltransferase [Streptomyces chitinivorans]MDH2411566.1 methyltransferase domain-containing protein [Streptomyces chitinivorans]